MATLGKTRLKDLTGGASHTVASHSDTTATGAELETLTDTSNADTLHSHAGGAGGAILLATTYNEAATTGILIGSQYDESA